MQAGWHLENGAGVSRDYIAAAKWYQKSAEQGNARAMKNLGQLHENGVGVPEDWEAAAAWYRKGAEMNEPGNGVIEASGDSGGLETGIGVGKNSAEFVVVDPLDNLPGPRVCDETDASEVVLDEAIPRGRRDHVLGHVRIRAVDELRRYPVL